MKLSIFTPTHRPELLIDAWESLKAQTYQGEWEWVIIGNGHEAKDWGNIDHPKFQPFFEQTFVEDDEPLVRYIDAPAFVASMGVGALKRYAVEQCTGDVFIELDHDDRLAPQALERIAKAFELGADFAYSDFANVRDNGECQVYDAAYGWQSYPVDDNGAKRIAMAGFDLNAASLHRIFYAPNHVRAWSRKAYWNAGGHNPNQRVTDDHDLVCRTYLSGAKFYHIQECLYFYRLHEDGQQTYLQRNAEIQIEQEDNSKRYLHALIAEECKRKSLPMLDLGAKIGKAEGYQSVDYEDADINCDIMNGLPFVDNSIGAIRAFDFMEHIPHCVNSRCTHGSEHIMEYPHLMIDGQLKTPPYLSLPAALLHRSAPCTVGLMNEIYRVLVPGGWLLTGTPSTDGRGAFQDPSHCSFWSVPNSFWYYCRAEQAKYIRGSTAKFQLVRGEQRFPSDWHRQYNILYGYADLVALKGQRQPGLVEI